MISASAVCVSAHISSLLGVLNFRRLQPTCLASCYLFLSSVCLLTYLWRQRSPPPVHCRPHLVTHSRADTRSTRTLLPSIVLPMGGECVWLLVMALLRDRRRRKYPSMAICQIKASACRRRASRVSGDRLCGRSGGGGCDWWMLTHTVLSGSFLLYSCGNVRLKVLIHFFL